MSLQVANEVAQVIGAVVDHRKRDVALLAEQAAYASSADALPVPVCAPAAPRARTADVIVIDHEAVAAATALGARGDASTYLASPSLLRQHPLVVRQTNAVVRPKLRVEDPAWLSLAIRRHPRVRTRSAVPARLLPVPESLHHVATTGGAHLAVHVDDHIAELNSPEFGGGSHRW